MATKSKAQKKPNLRHAEYYDFQSVQDKLYTDSQKGRIFKQLVQIIAMPENIRLAYRNIKKNAGSLTAGTDNKTIRNLEKLSDEQLIGMVKRKLNWYVPQSVRRVEIPKGNDPTKKRPLGIPTITDRLIQQCVLQVLEPICEAKFHEHSYGFRPNRSQENAISHVYSCMQLGHYHFVVDIDIKSFFDRINHGKLLKQLWTLGIRDKKLLSIISAMLKAEIAGIGFPEVGAPQGGVISPLLSNVVLNELDWWIASQWENFLTKHSYSEDVLPNGSLNKGNKYRAMRENSHLKEVVSIRYADDFKLFTKSYRDAVKLFHATRKWLKERLGLDISPEKSEIINLKEAYSEFLGFKMRVIPRGKQPNGQPKYVVESHIRDKALRNIKANLNRFIYNIEFPSGGKRNEYDAICKYNAYVMGVHNYYKSATKVCSDLRPLAFQVHKSLKARLKGRVKTAKWMKKRKLPCEGFRAIQEKYGRSDQLHYIGNTPIVPIGFMRCSFPMRKNRRVDSYTPEGRSMIHKNLEKIDMDILYYLMRNPVFGQTIEYNNNRLSLYCAQKGKCAVTGTAMEIGNIHCHHKTPRQLGGTNHYDNLVLVTKAVHTLIHATNPALIESYLCSLNLNPKQLKILTSLRGLVHVENC